MIKRNLSILLVVLIIIILIYFEYNSSFTPFIQKKKNEFDLMLDINRNNHMYVIWRKSLIVALIVTFLVFLILYRKCVINFTFLLCVLLVFVAVYFTSIWFQAHWWRENNDRIENSIFKLKDYINRKWKR